MAYDNSSLTGDEICDYYYDIENNFMNPPSPTGFFIYKVIGGAFDRLNDLVTQFRIDYSILDCNVGNVEIVKSFPEEPDTNHTYYVHQPNTSTGACFTKYSYVDGGWVGETVTGDVLNSLDVFWGRSYNLPRPSLPYLYTVLFEDKGVTVDSNLGQWYYAPSYSSASVDESGTTFLAVREGSYATVSTTLTQNPTSTDIYPYSLPFAVEFDLIEWEDNQGATSDYSRIRVYNQANNKIAYWNVKDYGVGHYKIVCTEGSQILYFNGVEQSRSFTFTPTTQWNVAFQTKGKLKFKNFSIEGIVYPILFRDGGVTGNHNDNWYNQNSSFTRTRTNTSTNLKITSPSANLAYFAGGSGTWASTKLYTAPFNVEFEITEKTTGTPNFEIRGDNTYFTWSCSQIGRYRVEITGTKVRKYFNGTMEGSEYDRTMNEIYSIGFQQNASTEFKYRNFVIYNSESPVYSTRLLSDDEYRIYLYLKNHQLLTMKDLLVAFTNAFGSAETGTTLLNSIHTVDHKSYDGPQFSNVTLAAYDEEDTDIITDTLVDKAGVNVVNDRLAQGTISIIVPDNDWDEEFLRFLESFISIKGNILISTGG